MRIKETDASRQHMTIRIKNLRLKTIVGIYAWERKVPQEILINIRFEYDGTSAAESDDIRDAVDYKKLKKQIIQEVESSAFQLIEKVASRILEIVMQQDKISSACVEVDKPHALRFADSVSVTCCSER